MVAQIDRKMLALRPIKALTRVLCWALWEGRPLTTRGRWVNPLVMLGFRVAQAFPVLKSSQSPLFIVGTGRSGTTVLGKLLSVHQDIVFLNEPKALWHFACGDEDVIGSYSTKSGSFRLDVRNATGGVGSTFKHVHSLIMFLTGTRKVVDKYPECVFRTNYIFRLFPRARFIAIRRNGVDTCASVDSWSKRHGVRHQEEVHDWWGKDDRKWRTMVSELVPEHDDLNAIKDILHNTSRHTDRAAVEWIVSMREIQRLSKAHPREVLSISYEDLCTHPSLVLGDIQEFAGVSDDKVPEIYGATLLDEAEPYPAIELTEELLQPFVVTLKEMGYADAVNRVSARFAH